jgi:hypothetical protein
MKRPTFALLPLDDRPPNLQFPRRLGAVGGISLRLPPRRLLGRYLQPGDCEGLWPWLEAASRDADGVIISCDMLAYGGLVASRTTQVPAGEAISRVERLRELRLRFPQLRVYAFAVIPRLGVTVSSPRLAKLGPMLARYHELRHRSPLDQEQSDELARLAAELPPQIIADHDAMRQRNLEVNKALVALVGEGALDFLVLAQEDAPPTGPHVAEQKELVTEAHERAVADRMRIYPGADETGIALMARAAAKAVGGKPTVYPLCGTPGGTECVALFEDRPLGRTIGGQIEGIGLEVSETEQDADIVFAFHAPHLPKQTDISCVIEASAPDPEFVTHLADAARGGKAVALADVAYCNGADPALVSALGAEKMLPHLAAFAAWNTAGNTIGTALAQAVLWWTRRAVGSRAGRRNAERAHIEFLFERLVDDYGYQTVVRADAYKFVRGILGEWPLNLRRSRRRALEYVRGRIEPLARQLFAEHLEGEEMNGRRIAALRDLRIRLPWPRLFEVEVEARIGLDQ